MHLTHKKRYGWKPDFPDHRDFAYSIIRPRVQYPQVVDLRPLDSPIQDEGALGSCTANALAGALQFLELKNNEKLVNLSRLFIYYNERSIEGTIDQDAGAQIRDGVKVLNQLGVCSEYVCPYAINQFTQKPTEQSYEEALERKIISYHRLNGQDDMLTCLADGFPFVFGFTVYNGFESAQVAKTGEVSMPGPDEKILGGHAVMAVGYDLAKQQFIVRNSWSASWGAKGYFYIPFDYLRTMADDFWTIRK